MTRLWIVPVLVVLAFASACDDDEGSRRPEPSPERPPEATATEMVTSGDCPNALDATRGEPKGSLEGDIDGDDEADTARLHEDPSGDEGCRAFLVAEVGGTSYVAPIDQEGMTFDLGFPALRGLVEIDGRPGYEIVAGLLAGASTEFFGAWTFTPDGLERLRLPGETGNLFPSGGSVGHIDASDCTNDGVVLSTGAPRGDGYQVKRTLYRFDGTEAVRLRTERVRIEGQDFDRFSEFIGTPFGSCSHP